MWTVAVDDLWLALFFGFTLLRRLARFYHCEKISETIKFKGKANGGAWLQRSMAAKPH